jgi:hypothetical protein
MWDLLSGKDSECTQFREELEALSGAKSREELLSALRPAQQTHAATCADCQEAVEDLFEVRTLLQGRRAPAAPDAWFAGRVMKAITAREEELAGPAGTWIAVPRLASRLALASGALLLIASTWLYEKPSATPVQQTTVSAASPEYLFEAPPAATTQDDVLSSSAEKNQ